jgi:hypothetical protein
MVSFAILKLNKKTSLAIILVFTAVVVFDSSIVTFSSYSGIELPISLNVTIFVIFYIIFVAISAILLISASRVVSKDRDGPSRLRLVYIQGGIIATQILTSVFILLIILQMLLQNRYSIPLLNAQTYLHHFSALVFLSLLVFLFLKWLSSKRSYTVVLYTLAFLLSCAYLVISFLYLESYLGGDWFSSAIPDVTPNTITDIVTNFGGLPFPESLTPAFDVLSLCSFLCLWIATALLLSQYRYKMGRIKYFSLLAIPLIYYIFPFGNYFGNLFYPLLPSSPLYVSLMYVVIFSATKQVGALVFSLVFWTASSLVYQDRIRKSLLLSSIGISIFYGSIAIAPLQFHVYPPYGLITEAFLPLGSYLIFIGIFTSAKHISRDSDMRRELYNSASSQLTLLKTIGVSQMEKELEGQVKSVEKRFKPFEQTDEPDLKGEEIKEILRDVLTELYYSKSKKKTIGITDE